jgi:hypothetical protein
MTVPSTLQYSAVESIVMWVHGHTVVPYLDPDVASESPLSEKDHLEAHGRKEGWGAEFRSMSETTFEQWFQVAIPTVSFVNHAPLYLDEVTLLFRSDDEACGIKQLDVWDGPNRTRWTERFSPPLHGDFTEPTAETVTPANRWKPTTSGRRIFVQFGLNVSIWVTFPPRSTFVFCAAGAEFSLG